MKVERSWLGWIWVEGLQAAGLGEERERNQASVRCGEFQAINRLPCHPDKRSSSVQSRLGSIRNKER